MNEWKKVRLGDVSKDGRGYYGIGAPAVEYSPDKYTYLRITDINDDGSLNKSDLKSVDADDAEKYLLSPNDIVFARTGNSTGRNYFYDGRDGKFVYAGFLIKFSLDDSKINPKYVKYFLQSKEYKDWVQSFNTGSTRGNINAQTYANLEIPLLPESQQDLIANILSSFDDKIELNNRIKKNLEEQAQALFKQWFVDFEFPNADGKPYRSSGGEMIESELGMIPKGWKVGNLGDIIELFDSKRIPLSGNERDNMEKIYPYYGATTLMDYVDDYLFDGIYLLLGEDGTVVDNNGFPILQYVWGKFWVNNHAHIMQGKNGFSVELLYTLLKNTSVQQLVTGAVQPKINQANLKAIHIIIPDLVMLNMFDDFIQSIYILTRKNKDENQNLAQMRDALLPRLMNGDAEI